MKNIFGFLLAILFMYGNSASVCAQWVQTGILGGGAPQVKSLAATGQYVFAGTDSGVFVSTNEGATWTQSNAGLTDTNVPSLAVYGSAVFAGTHDGVFRSTDYGTTWNAANSGPMQNTDVAALVFKGSDLFAATFGNGIFVSSDQGTSWSQTDSGITDSYFFCLAVSGSNIVAGGEAGAFLSTDNGASWNAVSNGPWGYNVRALAVSGGNLYAGVDGNYDTKCIYRSTDNGASWTALDGSSSGGTVYAFAVSGMSVFAGGNVSVVLSTDNGTSWTDAASWDNCTFANSIVSALAIGDTNLYAGTALIQPIGVFRRPLSQMVTAVRDEGTAPPHAFLLSQNYPNPFNPSTIIEYAVPNKLHVILIVYDVLGRTVETLVDEKEAPGTYKVLFDASCLPSGVYFYRIFAGHFVETKKCLVIK